MVDTPFTYKPMPYVGLEAAREAVLKPILKGIRKEKALKRPLDEQHAMLQKLWRLRALVLGEHNWSRAEHGRGLQYLRNCPPFGVHYGERSRARHCGAVKVCPNCFARRNVMAAFRSTEWLFYLKNNKPVIAYDLVCIRRTWVRDVELSQALEMGRANRNMYLGKFTKPAGGITLTTLEPAKTGWQLALATIVAAREEDLPDLGQADVQRLGVDHMTKRRMARMIGWAMRYPLGMMYGSEGRAAQMLTVAGEARTRQLVSSGAMRNEGVRKMSFR